MRLSPEQITNIRLLTRQLAGTSARVWLFGSRVRDNARGGDIDRMLEMDRPVAEPAQLSSTLAARVSRTIFARKVDMLIKAPNLVHLPIHDVALAQGVQL